MELKARTVERAESVSNMNAYAEEVNTDLLVTVDDSGNPVTTSLAIAEGVGNPHKAVIQLVRQYQADLEDFGRVAFEMAPFVTAGGAQSREVAVLNEQQATLLMTYMRNNDVVRRFKKRLVHAFYEMARARAQFPTGLVTTIARAIVQELVTEQLPKLIDAHLQHDPQRVAVRHIPALQVALDKGVNKRPRGLVQRISNALSRYCEGKGIVVLRDVRGTKLFDRNVVHEWLSNGGWAAIKERLDEVGGQSHLKLIR